MKTGLIMLKLPPNRIGQSLQQVLWKVFGKFDDRSFLSAYYYMLRGRSSRHLNRPERLCDIINWMKINYRPYFLHSLVDKYAVRNYVEKKVGREFLNEVFFVTDKFDESTFKMLPHRYVLKATHGSAMNLICRGKNYGYDHIARVTNSWLRTDYYKTRREWAYKGLSKRIMCEKLLSHSNGEIPEDLKVMCFRGEPRFIQVDFDRFGKHKRDLYDTEWNKLPFTFKCDTLLPGSKVGMPKPKNLQKILEVARELSNELIFSRIDLYNIDQKKIVFGEITIYPGSGSGTLNPDVYDYVYGRTLFI